MKQMTILHQEFDFDTRCKPPKLVYPPEGVDTIKDNILIILQTQDPGSKIIFTLDGSIPSYIHGIPYDSGIYVPKDVITFTFKAIAFKPTKLDSEIFVRNFKVDKFAPMIPNGNNAVRPDAVFAKKVSVFSEDRSSPNRSPSL